MTARIRHVGVLVAIALAASRADADPKAEALKQEGLAAARAKNWQLARERFAASYALDPKPLVLFNLAGAQDQTGQLVAARASHAKFLELTVDGDSDTDRFRSISRQRIVALEAETPTLRIRLTGFTASIVVVLDGTSYGVDQLGMPIVLDPGDHLMNATRGDEQLARRMISLKRGEHLEIELVGPPPKIAPSVDPKPAKPPVPPPPTSDRSVLRSPWFWIVASIVVAGGGAAGYYYVVRDPPIADPTRGTLRADPFSVR